MKVSITKDEHKYTSGGFLFPKTNTCHVLKMVVELTKEEGERFRENQLFSIPLLERPYHPAWGISRKQWDENPDNATLRTGDLSVLIQKFLHSRSMNVECTSTEALDGGEDVVGGLGPA